MTVSKFSIKPAIRNEKGFRLLSAFTIKTQQILIFIRQILLKSSPANGLFQVVLFIGSLSLSRALTKCIESKSWPAG